MERIEKIAPKEHLSSNLFLFASTLRRGASDFKREARLAFRGIADKMSWREHVPDAISKLQALAVSSSCPSCGSPACTAAFGAAMIVPMIYTFKEKLELAGSHVAQSLRF